jgi:hypothetical protein
MPASAWPGVNVMPMVFRVTARDGGSIGEAATMDGVIELANQAPPGRYQIEKLSLDPAGGELRSWDWGTIVKDSAGRVELDLPAWLD